MKGLIKMTEFLTCEAGGELSLQKARRLTEEEKKDYVPECAESHFIGTSNHIVLEELHYSDVHKVIPKDKKSDGSFRSCDPVYIITQEEWDALIVLNEKLKNERLIKKVKSDIEWYEQFVARCEESKKHGRLYTKEEAAIQRKRYNDIYNDGSEGFVPHFYTVDEYERAKIKLEDLKRQQQQLIQQKGNYDE